jgi:VWFA-related protein
MPRFWSRAAAVVSAVLLCAIAPWASPQEDRTSGPGGAARDRSGEPAVFREETTVTAIEVPVQVIQDGEPVRGLTRDRFRVWYDGDPTGITGFEVIDLARAVTVPAAPDDPGPPAAAEPSERPAVGPGMRSFLLFFDLALTPPGYMPRGLEAARSLVREGLHPSDRVGIVFYSDRRGPRVALHPTPDRAAVERVLDAYELLLSGKRELADRMLREEPSFRGPDPLALTTGDWEDAFREIAGAVVVESQPLGRVSGLGGVRAGATGGGGPGSELVGDQVTEIVEQMETFRAQVEHQQMMARASCLLDGLAEVARYLEEVRGTKHLLLLSSGFSPALLDLNPVSSPATSGWLLDEAAESILELQRTGWVLHALFLGGIRMDEVGVKKSLGPAGMLHLERTRHVESLFLLAQDTGGLLVENTNEFDGSLGEVVDRTSVTYLLTIQVAEPPMDGAFRPIRVEVEGLPRGARVVHRTGDYAPRPAAEQDPVERQVAAVGRLLSGEELHGLGLGVRATVLESGAPRLRVPLLLEIDRATLPEGAEDGLELVIYAYAFDGAGQVADFTAERATLAPELLDDPGPGLKVAVNLWLPPGRYDLRVLVQDGPRTREALRRLTLDVPAGLDEPRLLPPLFVERVPGWELSWSGDPYPFLIAGRQLVPAVEPVLANTERARILVPGLRLGEGLSLAGRVVPEGNGEVEPSPAARPAALRLLGRAAPEPDRVDVLVVEFAVDDLPAGRYRLEIALAGSSGAAGQAVSAPFTVAAR